MAFLTKTTKPARSVLVETEKKIVTDHQQARANGTHAAPERWREKRSMARPALLHFDGSRRRSAPDSL
jgi:hypothetical protein